MAAAGAGGGNAGAIRAGRAFVELFVNDKALTAGLAGIRTKLMKFGASLGKMGFGGGIGGGGVLGALGLAGKNALDVGGHMQDLSDRLGASVEELGALGLAAELAGEGLEGVEVAVGKMQNAIADGKIVGGLNMGNLLGLPLPDQIDAVAKSLAGVEDASLRGKMATEIFGKSGRKFAAILVGGMAGAREEMEKLSGLTTEEAKRLDDVGDEITKIKIGIMSFVRAAGGAIFGEPEQIKAVTAALKELAPGIRTIIQANGPLVQGFAIGAAVITGVGAALGGLGIAAMAVSAGLSAIGGIVAAVFSPMGAIFIGIGVALAGVIYYLHQFTDSGKAFTQAWGGMVNAIKGGDLGLALKIAFAGAKVEFLKFVKAMTGPEMGAILIALAELKGLVTGGLAGGVAAGAMAMASLAVARAAAAGEMASAEADLNKLTAAAKAKADDVKKRVGASVFGAFGLGGPTKGGFGTASQLGQQFGVGDSAKMLTAMQNTDKNTAGILKNTKGGGLAFT